MVEALKKEFGHLNMTFSIGGQISFDVFPKGQSSRPVSISHCLHNTLVYFSQSKLALSLFGWDDADDSFRIGWDKTYSLNTVVPEGFEEIHFFGDKASPPFPTLTHCANHGIQCYDGGNDWEIYSDERTIGHAVRDPDHTAELIDELFLSK